MKKVYNNSKEREVLVSLYANKAESIKYLPFFFNKTNDLKKFFNMFGGKTLVLPDTYEEFLQYLLKNTDDNLLPDDRTGIDVKIHNKVKLKALEAYLLLFDRYDDAIAVECLREKK